MARKITRGRLTNHMLVVAYRYHAIYGQHIVTRVPLDSLDLAEEWNRTYGGLWGWDRMQKFRAHLEEIVVEDDHDRVHEIQFCNDCQTPGADDDMYYLDRFDHSVCGSCYEQYPTCPSCDTTVHEDDLCWVNGRESSICEDCRENMAYCEGCDEYYDPEYTSCCNDSCDCESPAQGFSIRNDGLEPLVNDTRTTISLASGILSDEGVQAIVRLLNNQSGDHIRSLNDAEPDVYMNDGSYNTNPAWLEWRDKRNVYYNLANDVECNKIGNEWQTREGNFTKRLSRYAYKTYGIKVQPEVISEVGNIGSQHSQGANVTIEVTRDLNQSASAFAHHDSCWWQSYYEGRCSLKSNGGFGLRSFNEYGVTGRAWVMPLKATGETFQRDGKTIPQLVATFETMDADAFIVFNGYGSLHGYTPARVMAHMSGMTYRKVNFFNEPMYVNGEWGYLVASEEIAEAYTDGSLSLDTDYHDDLYHREQVAKQEQADCNHFEPCSHGVAV